MAVFIEGFVRDCFDACRTVCTQCKEFGNVLAALVEDVVDASWELIGFSLGVDKNEDASVFECFDCCRTGNITRCSCTVRVAIENE